MLKCKTPGCKKTYDVAVKDGLPPLRYCERCGWPLGCGRIGADAEELCVQGQLPTSFHIRVDNVGAGTLKWDLVDAPAGVTVQASPQDAPPGSCSEATLCLDPSLVSETEGLPFKVRLWERVGTSGYDFRLMPTHECHVDRDFYLPLVHQRHGPLVLPWRTVLFGGQVKCSEVSAHNQGETELTVTVDATEGYLLSSPGHPKQKVLRLTVPAGARQSVTIWAPPTSERGVARFSVPNLPTAEVALLPIEVGVVPPPKERWIVAVDFGTTKSAVMLLDQFTRGYQPTPVMWSNNDYPQWLPSAVAWDGPRPSRFGWEVSPTETGDNVLRSLKMLLCKDAPRVKDSIVFFLSRLFQQTDSQEPGIFDDARVVFTLPVLDNGAGYEDQQARTSACILEAGRPYNITEDRVSFFKEPECAAVDFLHDLQERSHNGERNENIRPGDWMCVLDMGGGTTDVTFAQFDLESAVPTFKQLHSVGYPGYAGDRIDLDFYQYCVESWQGRNRIKSTAKGRNPEDVGAEELSKLSELNLKGEERALSRKDVVAGLVKLKEGMYRESPPVDKTYDGCTAEENFVPLKPEEVVRVFDRLSQDMFVKGIPAGPQASASSTASPQPASADYPSVRETQRDLQDNLQVMRPNSIHYLCLTGGTSHIPDFERSLRDALQLPPKTTTTLKMVDFIRLNVVRGAARRPGLRVKGTLPFAVTLVCDGVPQPKPLLDRGAVPGEGSNKQCQIQSGHRARVEIVAQVGSDPKVLFSQEVHNEDVTEGWRFLKVYAEYTASSLLYVRAHWMASGDPEVISRIKIQQVPVPF